MTPTKRDPRGEVFDWCAEVLGPCEFLSDHTREHPGARAAITRLRSPKGDFILKTIPDPAHWQSEVHGYEQWSRAFGARAPRLIGVREKEPRALLISALPGKVLEELQLTETQFCKIWREAGKALAGLHSLAHGAFFGPVRRDGSCAGERIDRAEAYVSAQLERWTERGLRLGCLAASELQVVQVARERVAVFGGERPTACHRDYCPANWLVTGTGACGDGYAWSGVIDFEFAYWDVRAADFTRYPNWEWIEHPQRIAAFFEGYGRTLTPVEEEQRRICHVQYALAALVWGMENDYFGFAAEGRRAFVSLRAQLE